MQKTIEQAWESLKHRFLLSSEQLEACKTYAHLLQDWNKKFNLTAIDDLEQVIRLHFQDSLEITTCIDFNTLHMIADVGTGGGFPGLPLKIMFPSMQVILIEVNHKKVQFLTNVVNELALEHVHIIDLDWRTFIRQTHFPVDLFLARASLQPKELIRIYKGESAYKEAQLVYWASKHWQSDAQLDPYIAKTVRYHLDSQERRYVFFKNRQV